MAHLQGRIQKRACADAGDVLDKHLQAQVGDVRGRGRRGLVHEKEDVQELKGGGVEDYTDCCCGGGKGARGGRGEGGLTVLASAPGSTDPR